MNIHGQNNIAFTVASVQVNRQKKRAALIMAIDTAARVAEVINFVSGAKYTAAPMLYH